MRTVMARMRSALVLAVATVAGGFVSPATTRTGHLGVRLLVPMTAAPALALRSIPLARSSPTSHRCSPTSMGPPGRSGRRLGGRQPDAPAAPPRAGEQRAALSGYLLVGRWLLTWDGCSGTVVLLPSNCQLLSALNSLKVNPANFLPELTPVAVIAGGGLLACVLAVMWVGGSSETYYNCMTDVDFVFWVSETFWVLLGVLAVANAKADQFNLSIFLFACLSFDVCSHFCSL